MRVLLAFDKFKGAFSAGEACAAAADGVGELVAGAETIECPVADGGEGTVEVIAGALDGVVWRRLMVEDPLGRMIGGRYLVARDTGGRRVAVMEMSEASGLCRMAGRTLDPWRASTYGTGQMMRAAAEEAAGVERIIIGVGGSATNDGGCGAARALGTRFLDKSGREIVKLPEYLRFVNKIDISGVISLPEVVVASDVGNVLLGERGATRVYGAQKGVLGEEAVGCHEARLELLADRVCEDLGVEFRDVPGAGAAGGLGFGLMVFCGGRMLPGFDLVADVIGLRGLIEDCDVVLTGEGGLDAQTGEGKAPAGVARMAREAGKRVWAFAGCVDRSVEAREVLGRLFDGVVEIRPEGWALGRSMEAGPDLLRRAVGGNAGLRRVLEMI